MNSRENSVNHILRIERQCSELRIEALPEIRALSALEVSSMTSDGMLIASRVVGESGIQLSDDENKSVLGELEALAPFLAGYVSQIEKLHDIDAETASNWLKRLKRYQILNIPHISEWYLNDDAGFNMLRRYAEKLDYLRLVLIEYIDTYLTNKLTPES